MAPPDTLTRLVPYSGHDTMKVAPPPLVGDTSFIMADTIHPYIKPVPTVSESLPPEIVPSVYHDRIYIARSPADELRGVPGVFLSSPGPTGSPIIAFDYLNVSGMDVTLNGLPFQFQGLYRPYVIGTDLNAIPWEMLNEVRWSPGDYGTVGLDFRAGRPRDNANRSDIDVGRGPHGYEAARWRFLRPLGQKIYAYFTVGFKKSSGYLVDSDYDGFHVTGGMSYKIRNGILSVDIWQHKTRMGLNSFDYIPTQDSRQNRTIDRGELRYKTKLGASYYLSLTGFLQRNYENITGYGNDIKENYNLGGGQAGISDSTKSRTWEAAFHYYRATLFNIGDFQAVNDIEPSIRLSSRTSMATLDLRAAYGWNKNDGGIVLPMAKLALIPESRISPFVQLQRSRRLPDLNLLHFNDNVTGLGFGQFLQSYRFISNPDLSAPVTNQATFGFDTNFGKFKTTEGVTVKGIDSQIWLSYAMDSLGNFTVRPTNFDDRFTEIFARGIAQSGPLSLELSGSYRIWNKRFFPDGLEKGPAALGFARLSYLRELFIPRLYLGGSFEARFSSRRDYRSITTGFTDAFSIFSGRLEFRYKDLTIWLNDENLTNAAAATWWPYLETPRIVWVGFMWDFYD